MQKLFGVPITQLMVILVVLFIVVAVITGIIALRNRVMFKMAVRNVPRRRAQTALIVLGLMLATLLFSASLATGDTLSRSIRTQAVRDLGQVDVTVEAADRDPSGALAYFDENYFEKIRLALSNDSEVEGVALAIQESAPVVATATRLSEPQVNILGIAEEQNSGFDRLMDKGGSVLSLGSLRSNQIYISSELSNKLEARPGDTVQVFLGPTPVALEIAGVYEKGGNPAGKLSLVVPLKKLQEFDGKVGRINSVVITNSGGWIEGASHTDAVLSALGPLLEGTGLEAKPVKQDALDLADQVGSTFSTVFLVFAQFSIAAGGLLIFLIFVMLAAERKRELGIARAIGGQRGDVIRMFTFEGAIYALLSAAVGSVLGVLIGWGMTRIMAVAFGQMDLKLVFAFSWRSIIIAYVLGMVLTFTVVLISSWQVSRLNITRAIRDIPEPRIQRRGLKGLIVAILLPLLGLMLTMTGLQSEQLAVFMLGTSLIIIGVPLLVRRFGVPDRAAFTVAGLGLVVWWLLPVGALDPFLPEMQQGIEMFFLVGIMIVLGAVWMVIYNSDLLLAASVATLGRMRGLSPVLKTAVSYPMQNRFRTGVTLAMFSLVVFTLITMAFIVSSIGNLFNDTQRLSGGFHIRATTSYANPIPDMGNALDSSTVSANAFEAVASFSAAGVEVKQEGTNQEPVDFAIQGVDRGYTDNVTYKFALTAPGYDSPQEIWNALQNQPGTAVVSSMLVPTKRNFNVGGPMPPFRLEGFWMEDETLPEVYISATDPRTGNEQRLRVIGVVDPMAFYTQGIITSQETVNRLLGQPTPSQTYMFRLKEGQDAKTIAKALEANFLEHGFQAEVMADEIRTNAGTSIMINNLLQGFMGLGLVVGIAALGVIAARSVVERRQQIGVLRALGFQKEMVQLSFLLESSFIALLGIAIGIGLGFGLSYNLVEMMSDSLEGVTYHVPWLNILLVAGIAYVASLLTTYLPARQAANVYPAEALRYE
ncbi:MAG: ABC transporter permease [Chloroflexi bacterium]|nr:ABC transporter permease [Chloroflexota bacterium]